jgi:hypothetical protein
MVTKNAIFSISREEYHALKGSVNFKNYNLVPSAKGFNAYEKK